jgi:hypothetical protein
MPLLKTPEGAILASNEPESGECRLHAQGAPPGSQARGVSAQARWTLAAMRAVRYNCCGVHRRSGFRSAGKNFQPFEIWNGSIEVLPNCARALAKIAAAAAIAITAVSWPDITARAIGTGIVDSKGAFVGLVNGTSNALRQLPDGQWVSFQVNPTGLFAENSLASWNMFIPFYYTSSNCMGTPYLATPELPVQGFIVNNNVGSSGAYVSGGKLHYASQPLSYISLNSVLNAGTCTAVSPNTIMFVGKLGAVTLSFSPPLSIK